MRLRQRGNGFVRAHRPDGFRSLIRHRQDHVPQVFPGIMEGAAEPPPLLLPDRFFRFLRVRQVLQPHQVLHPLAVGLFRGETGLQLLAFRQLARVQVRFQHVARLQLPPAQDMRVFLIQHPRLGGDDQPPVVGQRAPEWAQAVAVQGSADLLPVGVQDGRGPVPGFHHRGVIPVQVPPPVSGLLLLPGFRQQDHACQRQRETVHRQEFQRVVQHLAVAARRVHHRQGARHFVAQDRGAHRLLPGFHPVMVAPDRIDFSVVQQHPLRMRLAPGGEGVRGEAGVHHGHPARVAHVLQVVIEGAQLVHQHHPLVDDRPAGQGADVGFRVLALISPP